VRLEAWIVSWVLWVVLRVLFASCRVSTFGEDILHEALRTHGNKVLGAIWHRNILYIIHVFARYHGVIMASRSRDGERIAQTLQRFGHFTPRGSRNDGGAKALEEMTQLIAAGHPGGLALDASTGPPYIAKSGIVRLASETGAAIVPMVWWAEPCWRLHGWDMTIIPKFFSHLVFVYGAPLDIPRGLTPAEVEVYRVDIEQRLRRLTYQVDHWLPQRDRYADPREVPVPEPVPLPVHPPREPRAQR
jgi:lysophospholipid acyltransferase (LPLAT)-like uncharacterized protein